MHDWIELFFEWDGSVATIGVGTFIAAAVVLLKFYKNRLNKRVYSLVLFHDLWKVSALALSISVTVVIAPKVLDTATVAISANANAAAAKTAGESARDAVKKLTEALNSSIQSESQKAVLASRIKELEAETASLKEEIEKFEGMLVAVEGPLEKLLLEVAAYAAERSRGSVDQAELFRGLLDDFRERNWPDN